MPQPLQTGFQTGPRRLLRGQRRFTLRSALAGVGVLCVVLALNANRRHREATAVQELAAAGIYAHFASGAPDWAPQWIDDHFFRYVDQVTNSGKAGLGAIRRDSWRRDGQSLSKLEIFFMIGLLKSNYSPSVVMDESLVQIGKLHDCRVLELRRSRITDNGLRHLEWLLQMRVLDLSETLIGNEGLRHLRRLTGLQYLDLAGTEVGDAGLGHLVHCKQLGYVGLGSTRVSDVGIEKLRRALPDCEVGRVVPKTVRLPGAWVWEHEAPSGG